MVLNSQSQAPNSCQRHDPMGLQKLLIIVNVMILAPASRSSALLLRYNCGLTCHRQMAGAPLTLPNFMQSVRHSAMTQTNKKDSRKDKSDLREPNIDVLNLA